MLTDTQEQTLSVNQRFSGLPGLAQGGYVAGLLASRLAGPAQVNLRRPVAIDQELALIQRGPGRIELRDGDATLAEARTADIELTLPQPPSLAEARRASARYPGFGDHPYPHCFACGPHRGHADGLRVFPGPVDGREVVAAPWSPPVDLADDLGQVGPELIWAAFDCAQLWSLMLHAPANEGERVVTASLAGEVTLPVEAGRPYVVYAWPVERRGSRLLAGAALVDSEGRVRASGLQTAVLAEWGVPLDPSRWRASVSG